MRATMTTGKKDIKIPSGRAGAEQKLHSRLSSCRRSVGRCFRIFAACLCLLLMAGALCTAVYAEDGYDQVAGSSSMGKVEDNLAPYGMTPVPASLIDDGEYVVGTECSSSFFRIEEAKVTVRNGQMSARLRMYSSSYLLLYPGTAEEAAAAPYEEYIPSEKVDGWYTFTVPVEALDQELDLAAFSKKKKKWYPRKILFHASDIPAEKLHFEYPDYDRIQEALDYYEAPDGSGGKGAKNSASAAAGADAGSGQSVQNGQSSHNGNSSQNSVSSQDVQDKASAGGQNVLTTQAGNPGGQAAEPQAVEMEEQDGDYSIEVILAGGSGRASVTTPTWLTVRDGRGYARILWSSPHYDYMILEGKKYLNETVDGGVSSFTIPITALDEPVEITADTTAMGEPLEIDYTLTFYADTVGSVSRVPQEGAKRVLTGALLFIILGGIVNHLIKKKRRV